MSKRAVEGLAQFKEVNVFLRGIVPQIGYPWTTVEYARAERFAGESKYPLKKMLAFAFDGITSFSIKPMRLILALGALIFLLSLLMLAWTLIDWALGHTVSGWASLMCSIWMIGGIQLHRRPHGLQIPLTGGFQSRHPRLVQCRQQHGC
jgi:hypothetical protein